MVPVQDQKWKLIGGTSPKEAITRPEAHPTSEVEGNRAGLGGRSMLDIILDPLLHANSLGDPVFVSTLGCHPTTSSRESAL